MKENIEKNHNSKTDKIRNEKRKMDEYQICYWTFLPIERT